jgi:hypothetical protein
MNNTMKSVKKLFARKSSKSQLDDTAGDAKPSKKVTIGGELPPNGKEPRQSSIRSTKLLNPKSAELEAPKQRPKISTPRIMSPEKLAVDEDYGFKQMPGFSNNPVDDADDTDEPSNITKAYAAIPILEQSDLPRGGVSVETKAVGRVQVGYFFQSPRRTDTVSRI